jgi:hypothetical protein
VRQFERDWHKRELASVNTQLTDYWEWVVQQIEADNQSVDDVIRFAMATVYVNVALIRIGPENEQDEAACKPLQGGVRQGRFRMVQSPACDRRDAHFRRDKRCRLC